jgi:hypothetical protein
VTLRPPLQAIFDAIRAAHPDGLTLDELSEELPSPEELAERTGLTPAAVRRSLRFGRAAGAEAIPRLSWP